MTTKEKEIFTTEEAAEMMGCSPSTIEEHGHLFLYESMACASATNCATQHPANIGDFYTE